MTDNEQKSVKPQHGNYLLVNRAGEVIKLSFCNLKIAKAQQVVFETMDQEKYDLYVKCP